MHYTERFSAAGRTSGGYLKREGKPKDHEVLVARLIDRPIRPMIQAGWTHSTQVGAARWAPLRRSQWRSANTALQPQPLLSRLRCAQ